MMIDKAAIGYSFRALPVGNVFHAQWRTTNGEWCTLRSTNNDSMQEFPTRVRAEKAAEQEALIKLGEKETGNENESLLLQRAATLERH